nr:60S ribosomal protein L31 [Tanacetum cinerariifolium]
EGKARGNSLKMASDNAFWRVGLFRYKVDTDGLLVSSLMISKEVYDDDDEDDISAGDSMLSPITFKKAPKAIKEIKKFAQKAMGTTDVRVYVKLNKHIWSRGIRSVPRRVRVRIARKRNDDEDAKEELYSIVTVAEIPAEGLKGLSTKVIDDED